MFQNLDTGMTRNKYLDMCEQLGKEPSDREIPPDWEDFPEIVQEAINTFNSLGDRIFPDVGYTGKDYTNLPHFLKLYEITDIEFFLEIISWLDSRAIRQSQEQLKREHDKLKRK
jgi:hypothetical protein